MPEGKTVGKALKRIFKQDDILSKIEEQPASFSLLMNPTRLKIFIHLCQKPCDHTRSISRAIETSLTTVNWHLGQLLENEYLESCPIKGKKVYWPVGMLSDLDAEFINCIGQDIVPEIMKSISSGEIRQKGIVKNLGIKQQNVDFWLNKMINCGILERKGKGMETRYYISQDFKNKIISYDKEARQYSKVILELLYNDGLMPKNARFKGSRLGVDIKLPLGMNRIHLECSPLATARGLKT